MTEGQTAERRRLLKRYGPAELGVLEANSPGQEELGRLRAGRRDQRRAASEIRRAVRAGEQLLVAMRAPAVSARYMSGARVPASLEEPLGQYVAALRRQLESVEEGELYRPVPGAERAEDLRLFATLLLMKTRHLRAVGATGAPARDPGPSDVLSLYELKHPQRAGRFTDDDAKAAVRRARLALTKRGHMRRA